MISIFLVVEAGYITGFPFLVFRCVLTLTLFVRGGTLPFAFPRLPP
jgi:hypothetical protein